MAGFNPGPNKNHLFCAGKRHEPIDSSEKVCKSCEMGMSRCVQELGATKPRFFRLGQEGGSLGPQWNPVFNLLGLGSLMEPEPLAPDLRSLFSSLHGHMVVS